MKRRNACRQFCKSVYLLRTPSCTVSAHRSTEGVTDAGPRPTLATVLGCCPAIGHDCGDARNGAARLGGGGDDADVRAARGVRSQRRGRDRHLGARPASHRPGPPAGGGGGRRARRKQLRRRLRVLDDPDAGNRGAPGHSSPPRCRGTSWPPGDRCRRVRGPVGGLRSRAYRICVGTRRLDAGSTLRSRARVDRRKCLRRQGG